MPSSPNDTYTSPLAERNASPEMLRLWSPRHKFNTWRRIWLAVAEAQHEMGLPVTKEQVDELRAVVQRTNPDGSVGITDAEIELAKKYEREVRHDVMSHVHALGDACPNARGIIHLGMTSQDVVCNADLLFLGTSRGLIQSKLSRVIIAFGELARKTSSIPTLGFTHYQPAQPTTVGRRCAMWGAELHLTAERIEYSSRVVERRRGMRGATGTQASFLSLFNGDSNAIDRFEKAVVNRMLDADVHASHGWRIPPINTSEPATSGNGGICFWATGQTYPRVFDTFMLSDLAGVAAVLHKIATDIRLLCNRKEIDEPFEDKQIGSSAMPYKRNPMRCERICGLSRFVMNLVGNAYDTAATQWLERTLDDSSNRRLSLPEAFLALDGALDLMHNVASGLIVHEAMVRKNLMAELPFMATENIMMACVKLAHGGGGDRQHYHELIRVHAQAAGLRVKQEGLDNYLLDRLRADKNFWSTARGGPLSAELDWEGVMDPMKYVGRSVEQTEQFIQEVVEPLREEYGGSIEKLGTSGPRV
jgi:adenylosuccinate lyase